MFNNGRIKVHMLGQVTVTGIVLSSMPIGDYDKRLTILTKERGKISAFAKGARKPNSAFLACSQPFSFGEFTLYEGRSSYNIVGVTISNYFSELRNDFSYVCYGLYFCEFVDYVTREGNDEKEVLKLLYQSLKALTNSQIGVLLVRYIFELKIITINGEGPQVFECIHCKAEGGYSKFSVKAGGMVCDKCKDRSKDTIWLNQSTLYTLQYIVGSSINKLYQFTVTPEVLKKLGEIVTVYRKEYIQHDMKSLEMLEIL